MGETGTYTLSGVVYCKKCNCPRWDHNEDPVDDCPNRHVYKFFGMHIVASSQDHAIEILKNEFGRRDRMFCRFNVKRIHGPFHLAPDSDFCNGYIVSEDEYVNVVETFSGGIVKEW